ncbi:MAG: hypothetical protein Q9221_007896 [Calogaya cf. arnoldii]
MSDPKEDVHMQSSSEGSEDDLDSMFPEANQPANTATLTPQNSNLYENLQQFSDLSPPTSQDPTDSRNLGNDRTDSRANMGQLSSTNINDVLQTGEAVPMSTKDLSVAEKAPGASWNNGKHQAEEDRAREQLLDRSFSLRKHSTATVDVEHLTML